MPQVMFRGGVLGESAQQAEGGGLGEGPGIRHGHEAVNASGGELIGDDVGLLFPIDQHRAEDDARGRPVGQLHRPGDYLGGHLDDVGRPPARGLVDARVARGEDAEGRHLGVGPSGFGEVFRLGHEVCSLTPAPRWPRDWPRGDLAVWLKLSVTDNSIRLDGSVVNTAAGGDVDLSVEFGRPTGL